MRAIILLAVTLIEFSHGAFSQEWALSAINANPAAQDIVQLLTSHIKRSIGAPAPPLRFQRLNDSGTVELGDYRGKLVLLNFWSTTCSGCRVELPALCQLNNDFATKDVVVLYLTAHSTAVVRKFLETNKVSGIIGTLNPKHLAEPYETLAIPCSFIVDSGGIIRDAWLGPATYPELEKKINLYLVHSK
jgi:peroxiredoxin